MNLLAPRFLGPIAGLEFGLLFATNTSVWGHATTTRLAEVLGGVGNCRTLDSL